MPQTAVVAHCHIKRQQPQQLHLSRRTSKIWHVHTLELVTGEEASQVADMKDGLQQQ